MENIDYYNEKKWCGQCNRYVRFLMSVQHSFCADCGGKVGLFSKDDWKKFNEDVEKRKYWAS